MLTKWQWASLGIVGVGVGASVLTKTFFYVIIAALIAMFIATLTSNLVGANEQQTINLPTAGTITDVRWVPQNMVPTGGIFSFWLNSDPGLAIWVGTSASTTTKALVFQIDFKGATTVSTWNGKTLTYKATAQNNFLLSYSTGANPPYNLMQIAIQGSCVSLFGLAAENNTGSNQFTIDQFIGGVPSNFILQYVDSFPTPWSSIGFAMAAVAIDTGFIQSAQWLVAPTSFVSKGFVLTGTPSDYAGQKIVADASWKFAKPNNSRITFTVVNQGTLLPSNTVQNGFSVLALPSLPSDGTAGVLFEFFSIRDNCPDRFGSGGYYSFVIRYLDSTSTSECGAQMDDEGYAQVAVCAKNCSIFNTLVDSSTRSCSSTSPIKAPSAWNWNSQIWGPWHENKWETMTLYASVDSSNGCDLGFVDSSGAQWSIVSNSDPVMTPALSIWAFTIDASNCPAASYTQYRTSNITIQ